MSSKECRAIATDSSAQLRLVSETSSGKLSKKGLPILMIVSKRLVTCFRMSSVQQSTAYDSVSSLSDLDQQKEGTDLQILSAVLTTLALTASNA